MIGSWGDKEVRERLELGYGAEGIEVAEACKSDRGVGFR